MMYTIKEVPVKYIGLDCRKQYDHATKIDTETGEKADFLPATLCLILCLRSVVK